MMGIEYLLSATPSARKSLDLDAPLNKEGPLGRPPALEWGFHRFAQRIHGAQSDSL